MICHKLIKKLMSEYGLNFSSTHRAGKWILNFWFEEEALDRTHICGKYHGSGESRKKCGSVFTYKTERSVTNGIAVFNDSFNRAYRELEKRFLNHLIRKIEESVDGVEISTKEFPKLMIDDIMSGKFFNVINTKKEAINAYAKYDERDLHFVKIDMNEPQIDSDEYYEWDKEVRQLEDWIDEKMEGLKETTDAMRKQREEAKNIWELHPRKA